VVAAATHQWVERVIGVIWALLALRFLVRVFRGSAQDRAEVAAEPSEALATETTGSTAAYRRERVVSTLTVIGMVSCAVGVLLLLFIPQAF
jgi:hypothetical protein